jgi:hypothetical protein
MNIRKIVLTIALSLFVTVASAAISTDIIGNWNGECVSYARSKLPSLPYGLNSFNDKLNIINSYTCRAGSVAVIDTGNGIGHVAVVEKCDDSGSMQGIQLTEANWIGGKITLRKCRNSKISGCTKDFRIRGYRR